MSWDQIIAALGTAGGVLASAGGQSSTDGGVGGAKSTPAPTAPVAQVDATPPQQQPASPTLAGKIGETLIGQQPRTGSVPQFTGDVMQGMFNPHGLVGQAGRLVGALASFSQGVGPGMQYLNAINAADAAERGNLANAAARGWTPGEYQDRFGQPVPPGTQTALQARDEPISRNPMEPQATPSMPERVPAIQFPNTPEELTQARDAEFEYKRALPNFGVGSSSTTQDAERAQRRKMPLSASENTALTEQAIGHLPPGSQFRSQYSAGPEGMTGQFAELPPENRSMDMETYNRVQVPSGYDKIAIPDQERPGQMYMKIVNTKTGYDLYDMIHAEALRTGKSEVEVWKDIQSGRSGGLGGKPGSIEYAVNEIQNKIQRKLSVDEITRFQAITSGKFFKPEDEQAALERFYQDVGYKKDPVEFKAEEARAKQYEALANKPNEEQKPMTSEAPSTSPFALGPTGQRYAERIGGAVEGASKAFSTIPADSPAYVAKELSKPLPKKFKKKSFQDLSPDDFGAFAQDVLATLTSTEGNLEAAGKELADTLKLMNLSNEEKAIVIQQISEELHLPQTTRLQIEKEAIKRLE